MENGITKINMAKQLFDDLITLSVAPWFHAMGFMGKILSVTSVHPTLVFLHKFEAKKYLECIEVRILSIN